MLTISKINKLGDFLRKNVPDESSIKMLHELTREYKPSMLEVVRVLREKLELDSSARLKTTISIIEKLRRDASRLSKIRDIAGVRVVAPVLLSWQDMIVNQIRTSFDEIDDEIDEREKPNHGYRAVHLIVVVNHFLVEIQIRTALQHFWAQSFEMLADRVGREIRYGGLPQNLSLTAERQLREALSTFETSSQVIARIEREAARRYEDLAGQAPGSTQLSEEDTVREVGDYMAELKRLAVTPIIDTLKAYEVLPPSL